LSCTVTGALMIGAGWFADETLEEAPVAQFWRTGRRLGSVAAAVVTTTVLSATVLTDGPAGAATGPRHVPAPTSMAVLGDSISQAFDSCGVLQSCPQFSWSTGDSPLVDSHATRIRALSPGLMAYNDAVVGAKAADLALEAAAAVAQGAQYVEVEMGANDACTPTPELMTPVATFRAQVAAGFAELRGTRVFVASVPDLRHLWQVAKDVPQARLVWSVFHLCQSMLANPLSTARADRTRRADVRKRIMAYNDVLRQECAKLPTCRYDHGVVFKNKFDLSFVSPIDYFHPSIVGQAGISARTWQATYRFESAVSSRPAA